MFKNPMLVLASLLMLPATAPCALAKAKIIHVPSVLSAAPVPNPPAGEDEAAGLRGKGEGLPKVLRLQRAVKLAAPVPAPLATALVDCAAPAPIPVANANLLYAPADAVFGGRIAFPTPAWDSARFLPAAGWSEQPELWASHVR